MFENLLKDIIDAANNAVQAEIDTRTRHLTAKIDDLSEQLKATAQFLKAYMERTDEIERANHARNKALNNRLDELEVRVVDNDGITVAGVEEMIENAIERSEDSLRAEMWDEESISNMARDAAADAISDHESEYDHDSPSTIQDMVEDAVKAYFTNKSDSDTHKFDEEVKRVLRAIAQ